MNDEVTKKTSSDPQTGSASDDSGLSEQEITPDRDQHTEKNNDSEDKPQTIACGYQFTSTDDAAAARQEQSAAQYLMKHLDFKNREMLFKVYKNALDARTFQTPVGLEFMHTLREQLVLLGMQEDEIPPVSLFVSYTRKIRETTQPASKRVEPAKKKRMDQLRTSILLNVFLIILVIGMFVIAKDSKNPNILNYEKAVVDKYASWDQELTQREAAVKEKELEISRDTNP